MTPEQQTIDAIKHWYGLAAEAREHAAYLASRGEYPGVHENKARLYDDTARALRLTLETGRHHCACCLSDRHADNRTMRDIARGGR